MKKYPKYKPSGVEWIGEVPEEWEVKKLKYLASVRPSNIDKKTVEGDVEAFLCNYVDVYKNDQITKGIDFMKATATAAQFEQFRLKKGDVLATKDSEDPADIAVPALVVEDFENVVCGYHLTQITPNATKLDGSFLFWALKSKPFSGYFEIEAKGVTRYALSIAAFESALIFHPSLPEQTAIAHYLDRKTAQIDQTIAEKERLIELFREERQAIINHAVTKGIRPGVKMKDSGVEWIGEAPEGWAVSKLKYFVRTKARLGWKGLKAEEYVESGYGFLSTPNIKGLEIDFENINFITEERYQESSEIMLEKGDILLAKDGSTLGIVNIVKRLPFPCTVNSSIAVLRVFENTKLHPPFLKFFIESDFTQNVIQNLKTGMGVPHLFQADINNFEILLPPIQEQTAIAIYIDQKTTQIDTAILGIRQEIALLQEYRQALIFEAVTGKMKIA